MYSCREYIKLIFLTILFYLIIPFFSVARAYGAKNIFSSLPLRILFVNNRFPAESGGTAVLNQITGLIDRGHDAFIYAKRKGPVDSMFSDCLIQYDLQERAFFKTIPANLDAFDIIYCQTGLLGKELIELKNKLHFKAKIVTCFRGADITKAVLKDPHKYDRLLKEGNLFLPVCDYFKHKLIQLGCDSKKVVVHHSAIDLTKFTYKQHSLDLTEAIRIVSVGRLVEKKGFKYAIQAVAKLIKQYPNIKYTIIGNGHLYGKLDGLIKKLGVQDNIILFGWACQDTVAQILSDADIFLQPSITSASGDQEGIPNTLKEAMAVGVPVISTWTAGVAELVDDGISGLLVPERDILALIEKIEFLITHPDVVSQMSLYARKKVEEEFDMEKVNDKLVRLFQDLLTVN